MKTVFHPTLTVERWCGLSRGKRILHILSELTRTKNALIHQEKQSAIYSLERALELADLTIEAADKNDAGQWLREFLRFRELLAELYIKPDKDSAEVVSLMKGLIDLDPEVYSLELGI